MVALTEEYAVGLVPCSRCGERPAEVRAGHGPYCALCWAEQQRQQKEESARVTAVVALGVIATALAAAMATSRVRFLSSAGWPTAILVVTLCVAAMAHHRSSR